MKKQESISLYVPKKDTPYDKLKKSDPELAKQLMDWQQNNEIRFWRLTDTGKDSLYKYTQQELDMIVEHLGLTKKVGA